MTFCLIKPLINSLKVPPQPFKVEKMTIYTQSILNAYPYFWILWWKVMKESYVFGWLPCTLEEIELFLLVILCHDFKSSLFFDLLCHFCMNFVDVVMSWASQSLQIASLYLPLGWLGRSAGFTSLPRHSRIVLVLFGYSLLMHTAKCARCAL